MRTKEKNILVKAKYFITHFIVNTVLLPFKFVRRVHKKLFWQYRNMFEINFVG